MVTSKSCERAPVWSSKMSCEVFGRHSRKTSGGCAGAPQPMVEGQYTQAAAARGTGHGASLQRGRPVAAEIEVDAIKRNVELDDVGDRRRRLRENADHRRAAVNQTAAGTLTLSASKSSDLLRRTVLTIMLQSICGDHRQTYNSTQWAAGTFIPVTTPAPRLCAAYSMPRRWLLQWPIL